MLSTHLYKGLDAYKIHTGQEARTCVQATSQAGRLTPSSASEKNHLPQTPPNTALSVPQKKPAPHSCLEPPT